MVFRIGKVLLLPPNNKESLKKKSFGQRANLFLTEQNHFILYQRLGYILSQNCFYLFIFFADGFQVNIIKET